MAMSNMQKGNVKHEKNCQILYQCFNLCYYDVKYDFGAKFVLNGASFDKRFNKKIRKLVKNYVKPVS